MKKTEQNFQSLTEDGLLEFLLTFDKSCRNNIEYYEWSNELLFDTIEKYPEQLISVLEEKNNKLDKDEIFDEVGNTVIGDTNRIMSVISKIEDLPLKTNAKEKLLQELRQARDHVK